MLFHLSHLGILQLDGPKAADFLQGQLTSDIQKVSEKNVQPAALCNLEGRIISLMEVCEWQSVFYLVLPQSLLQKVKQTLAKPAQFSRIQCIERKDLHVMGFMTESKENHPPFPRPEGIYASRSTIEYCLYNLSDTRSILLATPAYQNQLLLEMSIEKETHAWERRQLEEGGLRIDVQTTEKFLPHELALHETPYLSFNKGCYRGQEIIARMHYRAKLKYAFGLYLVSSKTKLEPGMKIYDSQEEPLGDLIDCCLWRPDQYLIAASLKHAHPMDVRFGAHAPLVNLSHPL